MRIADGDGGGPASVERAPNSHRDRHGIENYHTHAHFHLHHARSVGRANYDDTAPGVGLHPHLAGRSNSRIERSMNKAPNAVPAHFGQRAVGITETHHQIGIRVRRWRAEK